MPKARKRTTRKPVKAIGTPQPPEIPDGERLYILDVPFQERAIASSNGAKWNAALRATIYIGKTLPPGLHPYASLPFSWERWQEDDYNGTIGPIPKSKKTFTPRPHQISGAKAIHRAAKAGARGFLLADQVGLGKTITAIEGTLALRDIRPVEKILILAPLAVVPHWRRTIEDMGLHEKNIRVCVINYDRAKKLLEVPESALTAKRTATKNRRIAREGTTIVNWDVVILDESHKLKNPSQRTTAVSRIAGYGKKREEAPFVIWASATAGQQPLELRYLAPLFAQLTQSTSSSLKDFGPWLQTQGFHVNHEPRYDTWEWTLDPKERNEDIERMRALLFDRKTPVALRRLPTDISGWPEIVRILSPVELTPEQWRLYNQAWTEFRREMKLASKGNDPKAGMVARLRFRQKSSLIRIDGTVEMALELLENGHQVAISCQFLESLDTIQALLEKQKIKTVTMDGRDPKSREQNRLAFQTGQAQVVLFTPVEGFSLHQNETLANGTTATNIPRALIIHDPRYSGIESIQAEGRTHRDGQAATAYYMYGADTVEEDIVRTLLGRIETTMSLVGDDISTLQALEAILEKGL